jgi:hypothetical protein
MKIKIKIGRTGDLPFDFNEKLIKKWKSSEFEIIDDFDVQYITKRANISREMFQMGDGKKGRSWGYSDDLLESELPRNANVDFSVWITYVPVENNYFVRRLSFNRVVLSYSGMYDLLKKELIPVENLLLRTIYRYILIYRKYKKSIPSHKNTSDIPFIHDDTRGCLFDICVNKADVVFFLNKPDICKYCYTEITGKEDRNTIRVGENYVNQVKKECSEKIKRGHYYKIVALIKENPIRSLIFSAFFGILLNLIATVIYNFCSMVSIK